MTSRSKRVSKIALLRDRNVTFLQPWIVDPQFDDPFKEKRLIEQQRISLGLTDEQARRVLGVKPYIDPDQAIIGNEIKKLANTLDFSASKRTNTILVDCVSEFMTLLVHPKNADNLSKLNNRKQHDRSVRAALSAIVNLRKKLRTKGSFTKKDAEFISQFEIFESLWKKVCKALDPMEVLPRDAETVTFVSDYGFIVQPKQALKKHVSFVKSNPHGTHYQLNKDYAASLDIRDAHKIGWDHVVNSVKRALQQ